MESIHADEHKVLDRHRRETSLPATHSSNDSNNKMNDSSERWIVLFRKSCSLTQLECVDS